MCTATWLIEDGGYELFFNRDESRRRLAALPPAPRELEGVECLFPVDGDAGGTWLGVNAHGLALGLLNAEGEASEATGAPGRDPAPQSRGLLVLACLSARDVAEVEARLLASDLARHRGFQLACFTPGREPALFAWDGAALERGSAHVPLVSSSLDRARAQAERARVLERLCAERGALDARLLADFHASHAPERGPWSPCMHREAASTVSASRVRVTRAAVTFRYAPGPPCASAYGAPLELARSRR